MNDPAGQRVSSSSMKSSIRLRGRKGRSSADLHPHLLPAPRSCRQSEPHRMPSAQSAANAVRIPRPRSDPKSRLSRRHSGLSGAHRAPHSPLVDVGHWPMALRTSMRAARPAGRAAATTEAAAATTTTHTSCMVGIVKYRSAGAGVPFDPRRVAGAASSLGVAVSAWARDDPRHRVPDHPGFGRVDVQGLHRLMDREHFGLSRDQLVAVLASENVETRKYFDPPVHRQQAYRFAPNADLPITDRTSASIVSLPVYPDLSDCDVDRVIAAIAVAHENAGATDAAISAGTLTR